MDFGNERNSVYLSLGTNLGNRSENIDEAISMIHSEMGEIISRSGIYETEAWGYESSNNFYNCCVHIGTSLNIEELMKKLSGIERSMGRNHTMSGNRDRNIDIDILFFNDMIFESSSVTVPHPRMHLRMFVLAPLSEIGPETEHPLLRLSVGELLAKCKDRSMVRLIG